MHTNVSDGALPIEAVLAEAVRTGTKWISLTDHNTIEGVAGWSELVRSVGVNVIPGAEFDAGVTVQTPHRGKLTVDSISWDIISIFIILYCKERWPVSGLA